VSSVANSPSSFASCANRIRQVSRSPEPVNATDERFRADLVDPTATADAVAGSKITSSSPD